MSTLTYDMSELLARFSSESLRYSSVRPTLHGLIYAAHTFFAVGSPHDSYGDLEPLSGYGLTYDELSWVHSQAMPVDVADEFI